MSAATSLSRATRISRAFLSLGVSTALKYPLGFVSEQVQVLGPVVVYFFISGFVDADGPEVGGDYFTFVMVGLVGMQTLNAGLRALTNQIDLAVSRGWFEMILMEPVHWSLLPFAMALWPVVNALIAAGLVSAVASILGAMIDPTGIGAAITVALLGVLVGLAVGALASSVKVLAKRGDPVLAFYSMGALVLSGVYFPIDQLPPYLRWTSYLFVHTYVVSGMRFALLPVKEGLAGPSLELSLAVLVAMAVLLTPVAIWVFARAMEYGRRMGLLAGY